MRNTIHFEQQPRIECERGEGLRKEKEDVRAGKVSLPARPVRELQAADRRQ
ncbi:hypothetical protein D3C83_71350 [compost metagenome]